MAGGAALLAALPGAAFAHGPVEGIEGFYTGLFHPLTTPAQLLGLIALSLLAAARWPCGAPAVLAGVAAGLLAGAGAGLAGLPADGAPPVLLGLATAAATLAALAARPPLPLAAPLALAAGGALGLISVPDPGPPRAVAFTLLGALAGAALLALYGAGGFGWLRARFPARWMEIGQRILAAWVAAVAILLLALAVAPSPDGATIPVTPPGAPSGPR